MNRNRLVCWLFRAGLAGLAAAPLHPGVARAEVGRMEQVTLKDAVQRAIARNPDAQTARLDIERAEAIVHQVRSASLPFLGVNGTYTRLDDDRRVADRIVAGKNQVNANIQLSVPLIHPQRWADWTRASDAVAVSRVSAETVRRNVAIATARAYLSIVAQKRTLEVGERARDTAKAHYEYAHTRFAGGVGNRLDEVRAAQEMASAEVQVQNTLTGLARTREALGVLVGVDNPLDAAEVPPLTDLPPLPAAIDEAKERPDVRVERQRTYAAERSVNRNWADYSPYLSAMGQPFFQDPPTITAPQFGWQVQLLLSIPLYDGGLRYGLAEERKTNLEGARVAHEGALRQARSEVRAAFEAMKRADDGLAAAREAAQLARDSLDLSNMAYRAGATTNIEVIDAERRARDAESMVAMAEHASREARLDFLAASGRFP